MTKKITMTKDQAKALISFDELCMCGGYAWTMNGRPESNPHMGWCPQKKQYDAWYKAMHSEDGEKGK